LVAGGFPTAHARPDRARDRWYDAYLRTLTQRDVREFSRAQELEALPRLLRLLAARTAQEFNAADVARDLQMARTTLPTYVALLETVYLVYRLPAWSTNLSKKAIRHPKLHFVDAGLAAHLLGMGADALCRPDGIAAGPLLESFVAGELARQRTWASAPIDLLHFRDRDGAEVDLVLESRDGRIAGVEVKCSATVTARDFRGLDLLHDRLGARFAHGVVLHLGDRTVPFGDRRTALPLAALWEA
jgi:predicted AAA+ superfamily ATPase